MRPRISAGAAWIVGVVLSGAVASCTATTGTHVPQGRVGLSTLQTVGILVTQEEGFSVQVAREQATNVGAVFGSLVGAAIEAGARAQSDAGAAEKLRPAIQDLDAVRLLGERIGHYLTSEKAFQRVTTVSGDTTTLLKGGGMDGLLEVVLEEWGVRLCRGLDQAERVQPGFKVRGKISAVPDGDSLWQRYELYLDGACRPLEEWRADGAQLVEAMTRAFDRLAAKMVNEIRFP